MVEVQNRLWKAQFFSFWATLRKEAKRIKQTKLQTKTNAQTHKTNKQNNTPQVSNTSCDDPFTLMCPRFFPSVRTRCVQLNSQHVNSSAICMFFVHLRGSGTTMHYTWVPSRDGPTCCSTVLCCVVRWLFSLLYSCPANHSFCCWSACASLQWAVQYVDIEFSFSLFYLQSVVHLFCDNTVHDEP